MADTTAISWTDHTWPVVIGCSHRSAGCDGCYAEALALRHKWKGNDGLPMKPWTAAHAAANVTLKPKHLRDPHRWPEPGRVFVAQLADLFHPRVPFAYIDQVFDVMRLVDRHTYQVLTKRPERMSEYVANRPAGHWPAHVWAGTTIEDRKNLGRLLWLTDVPAPVRFVSFEPLLEDLGPVDLSGVHWAIVGGKSGPAWQESLMDHAWVRRLRDTCVRAGVAFHFKQSSGYRASSSPFVEEEDGSLSKWRQFPDELTPPLVMAPLTLGKAARPRAGH